VRAGRVVVDGEPAHLGQKVDPATARVTVDGTPLPIRPGLVYYLLNKPPGVVSTADDPQGRPTVVELVPADARVYPVGRLDADSEGLILLTNDGDLANAVTHPSFGVSKTYVVLVAGHPGAQTIRALQEGILLHDGPAAAKAVKVLDRHGPKSLVEIVMGEGRKREIRRMLDAAGHPVERLVRTAIGSVSDRALRPGSWRPLTIEEVRALYRDAGVA
jgi:23S rRNA pseudouridine2605 synthase